MSFFRPALVVIAWVVCMRTLFAGSLTQIPEKRPNDWDEIRFAPFDVNEGGIDRHVSFSVYRGEDHENDKLGLYVWMNFNADNDFVSTNVAHARLYRENGDVVDPGPEGERSLKDRIGLNGQGNIITWFPWGSNCLEACWIDFSIGPEHYWLELPYGFDRDPRAPLPVAVPHHWLRAPSGATNICSTNHLWQWENVHYQLKSKPRKYTFWLEQSNRGETKVELNDGDGDGKSPFSMQEPAIQVRIQGADARETEGICINKHCEKDGNIRIDTFQYLQESSNLRKWGKMQLTIGQRNYSITMPSSLFAYGHGRMGINAAYVGPGFRIEVDGQPGPVGTSLKP